MIARADEVSKKPLNLRYFGQDMVLYRGDSGRLVLMDAYCPHMGTHIGQNETSYVVMDNEQLTVIISVVLIMVGNSGLMVNVSKFHIHLRQYRLPLVSRLTPFRNGAVAYLCGMTQNKANQILIPQNSHNGKTRPG